MRRNLKDLSFDRAIAGSSTAGMAARHEPRPAVDTRCERALGVRGLSYFPGAIDSYARDHGAHRRPAAARKHRGRVPSRDAQPASGAVPGKPGLHQRLQSQRWNRRMGGSSRARNAALLMMWRTPILICVGLALAITAQGAAAADLMSVYREAQSSDAVYAAARASYAAAQEKKPQGLSGLLPAVTVTGNTQYNDRDITFRPPAAGLVGGNSKYNSNSLTVTATQPLFRYQNWISYEQAKTQVSQAEATFLQANQDLILRVAQAYFDILLAENNVSLAAAQRTAFAEQLAQAKRNFEVGTATITDANDAQARHDLAVSQEIAAQNVLGDTKETLRQIIGRSAPGLAKIGT